MAGTEAEWGVSCCVHGYHIYKSIQTAVVGEQLNCVREPLNDRERSAVAVVKDGTIAGHLPRKVSIICFY